jgi:phage terminase large subunit GpA-like protein
MPEKNIQGSCNSCGSRFPIPIDELEDYMECPKCGEAANITAVCPHCGQNIGTNGRTIGCSCPCPSCEREFIWNTVKAVDGTSMIVSMTRRVEMHDIASAISIMQQQLEKNQHDSDRKNTSSNSKGCLGSFIFIINIGTGILFLVTKYIV